MNEDGFQNAAAAAEHLATLRKQREDIESEIEGLAPFAPLELALFLDGVAWTAKRDGAIRVVNHKDRYGLLPAPKTQAVARVYGLIDFWAGAGKSAVARELMAGRSVPTVLIEFQVIYAALMGIDRLPSGRYPERRPEDAYALALTEYTRRAAITAAVTAGVDALVTNSDGAPSRREFLLALLGSGAEERVLDPGRDVVTERLSVDGVLSEQCSEAIDRWYGNVEGVRWI